MKQLKQGIARMTLTAKRYALFADGSLTGKFRANAVYSWLCRWCCHRANASEEAPATATLSFPPLPMATLTNRFDFRHGVSY